MSRYEERVQAAEEALLTIPKLIGQLSLCLENQPTWLDRCAWHALEGLLASQDWSVGTLAPHHDAFAVDAYAIARAMLAEKTRLEGGAQ